MLQIRVNNASVKQLAQVVRYIIISCLFFGNDAVV